MLRWTPIDDRAERESAREATSATTRLTEKKKAMHEFGDHLRAKETCRDD